MENEEPGSFSPKGKIFPIRRDNLLLWSFTWFWRICILTISISLLCAIAQLCLTLRSMDCNPPGSSVHWIIPGLILECAGISSSRGSSQPRDQTHASCSSCIGRQVLYPWATLHYPIKGYAGSSSQTTGALNARFKISHSKHCFPHMAPWFWNKFTFLYFFICVLNHLT